MSKRKIVLLASALCMVAILAIGGTLAYFTDTDSATNTFTIGALDITLVEEFDPNNAMLKPGKANAVNKDVSIKLNEGSVDSYVWYEWLIPSALDSTDGSTGTNNIVHVNSLGSTWDKYRENSAYWPEGQTEALPLEKTWDHDSMGIQGFIRTEKVDGIQYNVYVALYHGKLSAGQETTVGMTQAYLDSKVDYDGTNYTINGTVIDYDFDNGVDIIVRAYGIQADGFADVYEAYAAYQAQK